MKDTIGIALELITPERAQSILDNCPRNRPPSQVRVNAYARLMSEGKWGEFSQIVFDNNGHLVDGGHRLRAVVKSGCSVVFAVCRGVNERYVPFIDTGRPRTAGDMLAFVSGLDGLKNTRNVAALARLVIKYYEGDASMIVPNDTLAAFVREHQSALVRAYDDYLLMRHHSATIACGSAVYVIRSTAGTNQNMVDKYVKQISFGENIRHGMPTFAVRAALLNSARRTSTGGGSRQHRELYTILKGWEAFSKGEEVGLIRVPSNSFASAVLIDPVWRTKL